jgi:hypothetical protein
LGEKQGPWSSPSNNRFFPHDSQLIIHNTPLLSTFDIHEYQHHWLRC